MHGYELSKQLNMLLGTFRALSYGTLYPCLTKLYADGLIAKEGDEPRQDIRPNRSPGRSKIVYRLTAEGKERFQDQLINSGPAAWKDCARRTRALASGWTATRSNCSGTGSKPWSATSAG